MPKAIVTGGAGFLGGLLLSRLLSDGWECASIDLQPPNQEHPRLFSIQGDIRRSEDLEKTFRDFANVDAVFHCAAILAHDNKDKTFLWTSNVDGTRQVADFAVRKHASSLIYISSNCLWGENFHRPVLESDQPKPVEIYGSSKWEGEKILSEYTNQLPVVSIRCPTIIDSGRLGLLSILFEFIREGRRVWVVGDGGNRYQFIYAQDLIQAMVCAAQRQLSGTFNIGSDDVKTLREVYESVIRHAGTSSRVSSLPRGLTIFGMKAAHALGVSPLGPYHYRMIAEDFLFATEKLKQSLNWKPTLTNEQMLLRAYNYYTEQYEEIHSRTAASSHRQPAKMGAIRLLKWLS
jgi:UDP-glucose 4-epimerase